ncbi:MAG: phosphatase PAP2 family protein [Pseudomonadota bacterium]
MTRGLVAVWLAALMIFGAFPGIDLWVAGLFFDPETGSFPLADSAVLEFLRDLVWNAANLATLTAFIFGTFALLATRATAVPGRVWGFALLLILLGPVLLVNGVLKHYWGRARPADTDHFGGQYPFTPAWEFAGNCPSNCSFVSGEAAAVTCLAIFIGLLLWRQVADKRALLLALGALIVLAAGLRVAKGRHYISDAIWSVLLMLTLAHVLAARMGLAAHLDKLTWPAIRRDGARIVAACRAWGRSWLG